MEAGGKRQQEAGLAGVTCQRLPAQTFGLFPPAPLLKAPRLLDDSL